MVRARVARSAGIDTALFAETFVTLFVIIDPPGSVPVFLGLTRNMTRRRARTAAWQAVVVSFAVVTAFAVFGQQLLDSIGVSLTALRAAGGLLLLLVALQLLTGRDEGPEATSNVNVAFVPLGTPLLAGPGAIVATMLFVRRADGIADVLAVAAGVVAVHVVIYLVLRFSRVISRVLGANGVLLITRIAGLLLSAIAVQLVADAVREFVTAG